MSTAPCPPGCDCRRHWAIVFRGGEDNPNHRLTTEQVLEIRSLLASSGFTQAELAARYGVSRVSISHIATRKTWQCI